MASPQSPIFGPPSDNQTVFGWVTSKLRKVLGAESEEEPLQLSFGTNAEARGYGKSAWEPETGNMALWAQDRMRVEAGRKAAYLDYDLMDSEMPVVSAALDVIAEFCTQSDDPQAETFNITSDDEDLARRLKEKADELGLPMLCSPTAREIAKYGTSFWEIVASADFEIIKVKSLAPITMRRNEDQFGVLKPEAFTQIDPETNKTLARFVAWQITQGRYNKTNGRLYGNSLLESARAVVKKIRLMEDGMVVARLYRSHMRYIFQIPVDGLTADQAEEYLKKKKSQFRKKTRFNPQRNTLEQMDSPIGADEDFFMGVRKEGVPGKVETVQGQGSLSDIGDIEYFNNQLFAALKVPKSTLGYERDVNAKATLTEQYINFARLLRRTQQILASMISEVLTRWLITEGMDPTKLPKWAIVMPTVSTTDDLRQAQVDALKASIALIYGNKLPVVDKEFIWKTVMGLSTDEITRLTAEDKKGNLGVESMPIPAPPVDPNQQMQIDASKENAQLMAKRPVVAPPNPATANQPVGASQKESREQLMADEIAEDAEVVKRIRQELDLPTDDQITKGELHVARQLREFNRTFGQVVVGNDGFRKAFTRARNGNH